MEEMRNEGTSVLVVSHNLNAVRLLCRRTLVLHNGAVEFLGDTDQAISLYHDLVAVPVEESSTEGDSAGPVKLLSFTLFGEDGKQSNHVRFGELMTFVLEADFHRPLEGPDFSFVLANERGQVVYSDFAKDLSQKRRFAAGERARFEVKVRAALPTGSYKVRGAVRWKNGEKVDRTAGYVSFFVSGRLRVKGLADLDAVLTLEGGRRPVVAPDEAGPPVASKPLESDAV
jgi:lipopolysaccharide transport system ATP-binding protein